MVDFEEIAFMHRAPRFGHTNRIAQLASQDPARSGDYKGGLIAFSCFLLSFIVLWALVLLFFKFFRYTSQSWISGQVVYKKDVEHKKNAFRRFQSIQLAFTLAAMGIFTGSIVLLQRGLPKLEEAAYSIRELNADLQTTLEEGQGIATYTTNAIQPLKRSAIRDYVDASNYCSNETIIEMFDIENTVESMVASLDEMIGYLEKYHIEGLEGNINIMLERSDMLDSALSTYTENDWTAKMYILVLGILCFFIMMKVVLTWFGIQHEAFATMTTYFTLPVFSLLIPGGWLITTAFAVGATMNSDFCIGGLYGYGPEATIQDALLEYGISKEDLLYQSFVYYKSDCTADNPWENEVSLYISQMRESINDASALLSIADDISAACGDLFNPLIETVDKLRYDFDVLLQGMTQASNLARCDRLAPLYKRIFDGASCSESLRGLSWVFYSLFSIFLCAITMFTLRSALYKIKTKFPEDEKGGNSLAEEWADVNWEEFHRRQDEDNSEAMTIKQKASVDTQASDLSDEENGFQGAGFEVEVLSNQSSIETNESFNDDGVNSYNDELEPLTPSPKMKHNPQRSSKSGFFPTSFHYRNEDEFRSEALSSTFADERGSKKDNMVSPHTPKKQRLG